MEAFRQKDELAQLHARLPLLTAKVSMIRPLEPKLSDLDAAELDVLQLAYNRGTLGGAMDTSPLSDLDTAKALVRLIEQGYLQIDP